MRVAALQWRLTIRGLSGDTDVATPSEKPLTQLLAAVGRGDGAAREKLWSLIYGELHNLAQHQMADEASGHRRQPTSLVHEAYLRLMGGENIQWANRRQFFSVAAQAMRHIRIDDARKRNRLKRGGKGKPQRLDEASAHPQNGWGIAVFDQDPAEVLAVNEALDRLKQTDPRKAEVVMLRYFAGLTVDETAEALEVSPRTVDSDWRFARLWLHRELSKGDTTASQGQ